MSFDLLERAAFGVYEIFSNLIPGSLVVMTIAVSPQFSFLTLAGNGFLGAFLVLFLVFLSFIVGVVVQALSSSVEKPIFERKFGGLPSSIMLDPNDSTFPPFFKKEIRQLVKQNLGIPDEASSQNVFELCYTYVIQKGISKRVLQFLSMYYFSRNMMFVMPIEAFALWTLIPLSALSLIAGVVCLGLSFAFYERFVGYARHFAKEVLRSFYVDMYIAARGNPTVQQ